MIESPHSPEDLGKVFLDGTRFKDKNGDQRQSFSQQLFRNVLLSQVLLFQRFQTQSRPAVFYSAVKERKVFSLTNQQN